MRNAPISDDTFAVSQPYPRRYVAHSTRGTSETRPWSLAGELLARSGEDKSLLDIGCGDSRKTAPLAKHFRSLTALDPSNAMLSASRGTFKRLGVSNANTVLGYGESLPFSNQSFDVVCCMLAGYRFQEIYRVLRPGGRFLIEGIGPRDHAGLKKAFPADAQGLRGQFMECDADAFIEFMTRSSTSLFENISIRVGFWKTWLPFPTLLALLETTPIIRNFDRSKDAAVIKSLRKQLTPVGFMTVENRILITGQKG